MRLAAFGFKGERPLLRAKRPFIRKQHHGAPISLESGSGRGRLADHSGKPRHQRLGGVCEHREFVAAAFIPPRKPP
jgi:hypothetical protein